MSDMAEVRRALQEIRDISTATATNVEWIRAQGTDHDKRLRRVEAKQHWYAGIAAAVGALIGVGGSHGLKL
jgi:hypothetical protein